MEESDAEDDPQEELLTWAFELCRPPGVSI